MTMVQLNRSLTPHPENSDRHIQNYKPFSQEMHLKMPVSSWVLKISNSEAGCRVLALYFVVKFIPPMA
jgi:hypothetical protein